MALRGKTPPLTDFLSIIYIMPVVGLLALLFGLLVLISRIAFPIGKQVKDYIAKIV